MLGHIHSDKGCQQLVLVILSGDLKNKNNQVFPCQESFLMQPKHSKRKINIMNKK